MKTSTQYIIDFTLIVFICYHPIYGFFHTAYLGNSITHLVLLEIQGKQIKNLQVVELCPIVELTQPINRIN